MPIVEASHRLCIMGQSNVISDIKVKEKNVVLLCCRGYGINIFRCAVIAVLSALVVLPTLIIHLRFEENTEQVM